MDKIIIADTSCLIALDNIGHLYILKDLFSEVNITEQVSQEFGNPLPDWFVIHRVIISPAVENMLDAGEASAITLALTYDNPLLIIDEKRGRKIAETLHIPIIGTLKLLLLAKQHTVINEIRPIINLLDANGFRFSKLIVTELLALAGEA